jgi:predicted ATPase
MSSARGEVVFCDRSTFQKTRLCPMRIESLHFKNITEGWELSETKFDDLNLLVGVSGAGKTQILEAIRTVQKIAGGRSMLGNIQWSVAFQVQGHSYKWSGAMEEDVNPANGEALSLFIFEELERDNINIVSRDSESCVVSATTTPNLNPDESTMKVFSREKFIAPAYEGFWRIVSSAINPGRSPLPQTQRQIDTFFPKLKTLKTVRESQREVFWKLFCLQEQAPKEFKLIQEMVNETFPEVLEIKVDLMESRDGKLYPDIQIRVGENWIQQERVSSGMLKTILFMSEVYLSSEEKVFLIDEFENSLGINCLDVVTDQLFGSRELQFIITSHHPYVINNIPMEYWKVVTRKGGVIQTHSAEELKLGRSKHKAFTELINSKEFRQGVAA